jgi:hypothetical protein
MTAGCRLGSELDCYDGESNARWRLAVLPVRVSGSSA